jgi:hypothetical protein
MKIDGEDLMNIRDTRRLLDRAMSMLRAGASQDEIIEVLDQARDRIHDTCRKLALHYISSAGDAHADTCRKLALH